MQRRTPAPIRDLPRAELLIRRRRVIASALWIAAPGLWIARYFIAPVDPAGPELITALIISAMLLISSVGLPLRPGLARGIGLTALLLGVGMLALYARSSPSAVFLATAAAGCLGFGLITHQEGGDDVDTDPDVAGMLWSRAILISAPISVLLGGLALASQVAPDRTLQPTVAALLAAAGLIASIAERDRARSGRPSVAVFRAVTAATVVGAFMASFSVIGLALLVARLLYAVSWAVRERRMRTDLVGLARMRPAQFAFMSFGLGALGGAMVLALPLSASGAAGIGLVNALFTATSAICVTGLAVVDTGADLSTTGQVIVLVLIQVGGLGIMTLSAIVTLAAGGALTGGAEQALGETIGSGSTPAAVMRTIRSIAIGTVSIELVGAILLFLLTRHRFDSTLAALWFAVFHSISAFCNAGFALDSGSVTLFQKDPLALHVVSFLIIAGGAGFGVMSALLQAMLQRVRRGHKRPDRLETNTKVVLVSSAVLLLLGFAAYLWLEWSTTLSGLSIMDRLHNAWFQSVTFRTAGFNSVDLPRMRPATLCVALLLMFIGASPGSTGGGIKTTTAAVLLLSIRNVFTGRSDTEAFHRRIAPEVVRRATAVTMLSLATVFIGVFLLLLTQQAPVEVLVFEVVSAVGTVGLTIGGTAALDESGKVIVMVLMLLGRVGPITAAALLQRSRTGNHRFPRGEVTVG